MYRIGARRASIRYGHGLGAGPSVSNGGRRLDQAPAPLELLPAIHEAVEDRLMMMLDSGVRRVPALCQPSVTDSLSPRGNRAPTRRTGDFGRVSRNFAFLSDFFRYRQRSCCSIRSLAGRARHGWMIEERSG